MKLAIVVAEAPIKFNTTLKLGTDCAMNKPSNTIILLRMQRFQPNSKIKIKLWQSCPIRISPF